MAKLLLDAGFKTPSDVAIVIVPRDVTWAAGLLIVRPLNYSLDFIISKSAFFPAETFFLFLEDTWTYGQLRIYQFLFMQIREVYMQLITQYLMNRKHGELGLRNTSEDKRMSFTTENR